MAGKWPKIVASLLALGVVYQLVVLWTGPASTPPPPVMPIEHLERQAEFLRTQIGQVEQDIAMLEAIRAEAAKKADDVQAAISKQQGTRTNAPPVMTSTAPPQVTQPAQRTSTTPPHPTPPQVATTTAPPQQQQQQKQQQSAPGVVPAATTTTTGGERIVAPTPVQGTVGQANQSMRILPPNSGASTTTTNKTPTPTVVAAAGGANSAATVARTPVAAPMSMFFTHIPKPMVPNIGASNKEPGANVSVSEKQAMDRLEGVRWHSPLQPFEAQLSGLLPRRRREQVTTSNYKPTLKVICDTQATRPIACDTDHHVYRANLTYPAFSLELPRFVTQGDLDWFNSRPAIEEKLHEAEELCDPDAKRLSYSPLCRLREYSLLYTTPQYTSGALEVIIDGYAHHCSREKTWKEWTVANDKHLPIVAVERMIPLIFHDDWTLQRTVDSVLLHAAQAWDLIATKNKNPPPQHQLLPHTAFVTSTHWNFFPRVLDLYRQIGIEPRQPSPRESLMGKQTILPCWTPHMHPYLWRRLRDMIGVPEVVPDLERKFVIYLSRAPTIGRLFHQDRFVLNEDAVRETILDSIAAYNPRLEFLVFNHTQYSFQETMELFRAARAVIGPEGGAFLNLIYAPMETVVIEFVPVKLEERATVFVEGDLVWRMSTMMGQIYYQLPTNNVEILDERRSTGHMIVDTRKIAAILKQELVSFH